MHTRRLAAFLLSAWLTGSALLVLVATHNLRSVELMVTAPPTFARYSVEALGTTAARNLLHFQAAELNRYLFDRWEWVQIVLGIGLLLALRKARSSRLQIVLCSLMLLLTSVMHFAINPPMTRLGRLIDFVPQTRRSADRDSYWRFHAAYSGVEGAKDLLGLMLLSSLLRRHGTAPVSESRKKWVRAS